VPSPTATQNGAQRRFATPFSRVDTGRLRAGALPTRHPIAASAPPRGIGGAPVRAFPVSLRPMRSLALLLAVACSACAPAVWLYPDLRYANARVTHQTSSAQVDVITTDVDRAYDVLGDLEVIVRQRGAFGELPTRAIGEAALREQAGQLGAHAVILVSFGQMGTSWWSYNELRGHGRAVRFR
jgi:hypothetical protein